jgi:uncharacterized protein (DUF983 family)
MSKWNTAQILHKSWVGLSLRCPNCEQGKMFDGLLHMLKECPVCGVRFERQSGESVGGMYFNLGIAELITIPGFLLIDTLFHPPFIPHVLFWLAFTVLFCLFFYRHARGLWVAISHLTGGVQTDSNYEKTRARPEPTTSPYQD